MLARIENGLAKDVLELFHFESCVRECFDTKMVMSELPSP